MKKVLTFLLSLMMGVSLTACSSKPSTDKQVDDPGVVVEEPTEEIAFNEAMYGYFEVVMDSAKDIANYEKDTLDSDYAVEIALEDLDSLIQCADLEEVSTVEEIEAMIKEYKADDQAKQAMKDVLDFAKDSYTDNEMYDNLVTAFNK